MIKFAVSFIAGIVASNFFSFFPFSITAIFLLSGGVLLFRQCEKFKNSNLSQVQNGRKITIIILLAFVFGFLYNYARHIDVPNITLTEDDVVIEGTIDGSPSGSNELIMFTLDELILKGVKINGKIRLSLVLKEYPVELVEYLMSPGNRVKAVAGLKEPHVLSNPGVYSYDLTRRGVIATGYVKHLQLLQEGSGAFHWIYKKRRKLSAIINNSLSRENASFLQAIIPGFKDGLNLEMRDAFSSTGLAHLLSISGTHFGLLAFVVFIFIKSLIKLLPYMVFARMTIHIAPVQVAVIMTLPVLFLYAFISGLSTPTVRALVMVIIYMLALFLGRKNQWLNSLSIAAVLILLWRPDTLFELSFMLSFLAVLSIGYVLELRARRKEHREQTADNCRHPAYGKLDGFTAGWRVVINSGFEKAKTAPLMTVAAVLGTAPIVAAVFKQFPLISPVTNIVVTPLVCFILLPLGFFSGFCALIFDMPVMPLNGLINVAAGSALSLIELFSRLPYANVRIHTPSYALSMLYYISLFLIVRFSGKTLWGFLPFVLVICLYMDVPRESDGIFRVTFLDVGQGDAAVVDLPDGKVMLIDGSTERPDMGRRVVAPYLWARGTNRIDFVVVSHLHPDHYGGLVFVLDNFEIGEIWMSGRRVDGAGYLQEILNTKKVTCKILERGDLLKTETYRVYVLHPYDEYYADASRGDHSNQNNDSLVLKIETNNASVLFTGDIEREAEEDLLSTAKWLDSDIIKVPHHGSRTSSTKEFISAVSPSVAIVSSGRNNPFKHPHEEVLYRYNYDEVRLLRTDSHGAVVIEARNNSFSVTTGEDRVLREVSAWRDELHNLRVLLL